MIRIENEFAKSEYKRNVLLLKKAFDKGNRYLLWKRRSNIGERIKDYSFFSIIKDIEDLDKDDCVFHVIDYRLDGAIKEEKAENIEDARIELLALNTRYYDIFLLTEEEAKPYLKQALVMSLNNEPIKVDL